VRRIYYARQQLMTEPSRERRLRMIPDQVRRTIGFDRSMLFVAEDTSLKLLAAYPTTLPTGESIDVEADLFECEAFRDRHAIAVPTANGRSPVWLKAYKDVSSYAVAPIVRDDHSVGLLVGAYTRANREVDASDLQLLQIFAYNIRGALEAKRTDDPLPGGPWAQG